MNGRQAIPLLAAVVLLCPTTVPVFAANILVNGSFDAALGSPWVEDDGGTALPLIVGSTSSPIPPQTADKLAWLGRTESVTTRIYQDVAVPSGTTQLELGGFNRIITTEPGGLGLYDFLYAELVTTDGALLEVLGSWNNLSRMGEWVPFHWAATGNYAGQTIRLQFRAVDDPYYVTNFFLDTVTLDAAPALDAPHGPVMRSGLSAARPNPTRGPAQMRLELASRSRVRASVYDLSGRLVRRIADADFDEGAHDLTWDGMGNGAGRAAPGVYVCRVEIDGHQLERTIALIR